MGGIYSTSTERINHIPGNNKRTTVGDFLRRQSSERNSMNYIGLGG